LVKEIKIWWWLNHMLHGDDEIKKHARAQFDHTFFHHLAATNLCAHWTATKKLRLHQVVNPTYAPQIQKKKKKNPT
jgi:hypothetical protein